MEFKMLEKCYANIPSAWTDEDGDTLTKQDTFGAICLLFYVFKGNLPSPNFQLVRSLRYFYNNILKQQ